MLYVKQLLAALSMVSSRRRPVLHGMRRDLQDLRKLPRSAFVSYQKKHAQPHSPRSRAEARQRLAYPSLSAFAPHRFWKWLTEYWRFRIGRRHPFQTYDGEDGDNGIYRLRGDAREIRIALAGDWGTGTDEAAEVAALIEALAAALFDPSGRRLLRRRPGGGRREFPRRPQSPL